MKRSNTAASSTLLVAVLLVGPAPASQELAEFEAFKQQTMSEFEQYKADYLDQFDQHRQELMKLWGRPLQSDADTYVNYSNDLTQRTVVDFSNDTIEISVIHEPGSAPPLDQAVARLQQISTPENQMPEQAEAPLVRLSVSAEEYLKPVTPEHSSLSYSAQAEKEQEKLISQQHQQALVAIEKRADLAIISGSDEAKVESQLDRERKRIKAHEMERLARLKAQYSQQMRHDPSSKVVTTYKVTLPNKQIASKAKPYLASVKSESERWHVAPELIFAIMKAESSFNPRAKSHIPAFGLMQIVPSSAGKDVNDKLLSRHGKPSEYQLFQPSENIQYGTAYLHLLYDKYLARIEDPKARLYCTIAAYNTGPGNVARAFNPDRSRNILKAAPIINQLSSVEVFDRLKGFLPYDETKVYLDRVVDYHEEFATLKGEIL
ncbi:transglycosylase SLT domain-containing protein [Ferrimonas futtsuensis]|uniref:transglycosylase SLT domain-containing protein n=1 Tax=Ferrimonas futtsuensis TaxID=364764 RepID=UPI00041EE4D4|nr:transglycosylase SLT domain-containing protein [Ferrimonas futtsuensis]